MVSPGRRFVARVKHRDTFTRFIRKVKTWRKQKLQTFYPSVAPTALCDEPNGNDTPPTIKEEPCCCEHTGSSHSDAETQGCKVWPTLHSGISRAAFLDGQHISYDLYFTLNTQGLVKNIPSV